MGTNNVNNQRGVQSAEVVLRLLRVLVEAGKPMMLRDVAAAAHMPPAKAHRYLVSLARQGFVEQEGTGGLYDLGAYALELALACLARIDHVRVASEALQELCRRVDETVALAVWGNRGPVFVRWEEPAHPVATNVRVGSVVPVLSSASGLVFAAFLPPAIVEPLIAEELRQSARARHARSPHSRKEVEAMLARVRREGLARVEGDLLSGVNAISAPVFDHREHVVLAITALGDERRFDASLKGRVAHALRETADAVSRRLGYRAAATQAAAELTLA
jgi:DNA-binding IclR family transcriptional regulator